MEVLNKHELCLYYIHDNLFIYACLTNVSPITDVKPTATNYLLLHYYGF